MLRVMPIIPCPPTTAGDILIMNSIRGLAEEYEQHLFAFFGAGQTLATANPLRPWLASLTVLRGTHETFTAEPQTPWAVNHHYARAMAEALREALARYRPAIVQFEFWFMAQYCRHVPELRAARTCVQAIDVEYVRRARMAPGENDVPAARYREWELRLLGATDRIIAVCERDRELLQRELPGHDIRVTPVCIPVAPLPGIAPEFALTFVGAFDHYPNVQGVLRFATVLWPRLRQRYPELKLYIVGRRPPAAVLALAARGDGLIVTGTVAETGSWLQRSLLSVVPLYIGSGIKTKIIEALGYGLPVVTTPVGEEGLAGAPGLLVGRTDDELFAHIAACLDDANRRAQLGAAGRAFYLAQHGEDVYRRRLPGLYRDLPAG